MIGQAVARDAIISRVPNLLLHKGKQEDFMVRKKKQKTEERAPIRLMPTVGARLETTLDDDLRTRELILFVRWVFGKPGLQISDYAGTLSSTVATTTAKREAQRGKARTVQAA